MKYRNLFLILMVCSTSLFGQTKSDWINFDWHSEIIFGKYYPKVAISIPMKIENLPYNYCGQFDLGATTTMIYENSFKPFSLQYPMVLQKLDTTINPYYLNGRKSYFLKGLNIKLDKTTYRNRNIALIPGFGDEIPIDSINTKTQKLIGTIAPDLFQGKILVIDFVHNRLKTFDKLPKQYAKANFVNAVIRKGRIKIPILIGDSIQYVMFDTGNCLGDLLLDKETVKQFTDLNEAPQEFLNGNTWGQSVAYFYKKLTKAIYLNDKVLNLKKVQFSDQDSDVQFNKEEKIIGLIGPILFADNIIIVDYKNNKFGVL
ncbi:MAG: hypothetical protein Q8K92_11070 [Leadbetterella sp.]|nr:hypothetical protein [Leadbetterella sp.]